MAAKKSMRSSSRRSASTSRSFGVGSAHTKLTAKAKKTTGYSHSVSAKAVSSSSKSIGRKSYISANSTRYKARFRREGVRYAKKKG